MHGYPIENETPKSPATRTIEPENSFTEIRKAFRESEETFMAREESEVDSGEPLETSE